MYLYHLIIRSHVRDIAESIWFVLAASVTKPTLHLLTLLCLPFFISTLHLIVVSFTYELAYSRVHCLCQLDWLHRLIHVQLKFEHEGVDLV